MGIIKKKENDINKRKINKLEENITELNTKQMKVDDEVAVKLKQYEVQVITIDENKKLIEKYEQQIGQLKTNYQLLEEKLQRVQKTNQKLESDCGEKDEDINSLKKQIEKLQQQLGLAGIGKNKNSSELELLRKNVDELTQIIRLRDFEIKKLKNQSYMIGNADSDNNELKEKIKAFEDQQSTLTKENLENKQKSLRFEAECKALNEKS